MYIRITQRCNMTCKHCCFDCTTEGEDMSLETFLAAKRLAKSQWRPIDIGGGEPTVHPYFWHILHLSLLDGCTPGITTNGKLTEDAIKLSEFAHIGKIYCRLSQDKYHEPISPIVVHAFRGMTYKYSEYIRAGRNLEGVEACTTRCPVIEPSGDIKYCGCNDSPVIGNVKNFRDRLPNECYFNKPVGFYP